MNQGSENVALWTNLIVQYKTAADILMQSEQSESVLMPAAFLYRQCVELLLKRHLFMDCQRLQLPFEVFAKTYQKKHSLETLYQGCLDLAVQVPVLNAPAFLDTINADVAVWQSLDPESVAFRYPMNSDGSPMVVPLTPARLLQLGMSVERLITLFDHHYVAVMKEM